MDEKGFAEELKKWLQKQNLGKDIEISNGKRLAYALEINEYFENKELKPDITKFETDILISQKTKKGYFPLVVIEIKLGSINTHDAMVYGLKADHHRAVHPYLRYGMLLGDRGNFLIPGRLIRHGRNFDFLVALEKEIVSKRESSYIIEMLREEITAAKKIRNALMENRKQDRTKYWCIHSGMRFK